MTKTAPTLGGLSRKKHVIFIAMMITVVPLLALLSLESLVRIFSPQQEAMRWFKSDPDYGYVLKRNFYQSYGFADADFAMQVRTNSLGLRAREYDLSRTDVPRILLLGDSFVFGHGVNVEDRIDSIMENLFSRSGDMHLVINTGVGGWGTLQEMTYARDHLQLFEPDIVIVTFCGNDPDDDSRFSAGLSDNERGTVYFPGKVFLRNYSHLYRLVFSRYHILLHNWLLSRKTEEHGPLVIDPQSASSISPSEWARTLQYIRDFHAEFMAHNPDGILLVQASAPLNPDISAHLESLSNGTNLIFVDLSQAIGDSRPQNLKLAFDAHWSPVMHSIAGHALYDTIVRLRPRDHRSD